MFCCGVRAYFTIPLLLCFGYPPQVQPEDIDPYTLFIGNLPNVVTVQTVKQMFPAAKRIDIGHAQRIKHTRYAFIRFTNVEEAIQAFKANHNKVIDGKNIIIRFRRHNAPIALPEDTTTPKTPKRQKAGGQQPQQPQLVVSVEQRPKRLSLVPAAAGPGHSGTLSTIKTEILDEDDVPDGAPVGRNVKRYEGAGGPLCVIKSEPDDTDIEDSLEEEEDVDNIRDCKGLLWADTQKRQSFCNSLSHGMTWCKKKKTKVHHNHPH